MVKSSQSLEGMVRVSACLKDRGGTIVRINKLVGGFGAGTGVWVAVVAVRSSWDWMELWMVNSMALLFSLHAYSLWIAAVCSNAHV